MHTMLKMLFSLYPSLMIFICSGSVQAHPHSWVEMKTYVQGSETLITGFQMEWVFDAMTTAYMLDGEDLSPEHQQESLQTLADGILSNMLGDHYFTYFYDEDKPIRYLEGRNAQLSLKRGKGVLSFDLPLVKPQPITESTLKLLIFEPSYYVDMTWKHPADVILSDALAKNCSIEMVEPNPTPEQMNYALSLPLDADPDNALGQLFTQTVRFHCVSSTDIGESIYE